MLPPRLRKALLTIAEHEGDDLRFVLGYLCESTARSYVSQLKSRGLAYTYDGEVWLTKNGRKHAEK